MSLGSIVGQGPRHDQSNHRPRRYVLNNIISDESSGELVLRLCE